VSESYELPAPDRFTAGTVGPPGQRTFFLQARDARALVTLKVEKEQVAALAEYLAGLLARMPVDTAEVPQDLDLLEPIEPVWAVASIAVGYDGATDRILVVANEVAEEDDEEEEEQAESAPPAQPDQPSAAARFSITRPQAAAFVLRAQALMQGGRPVCPLCSQPKDPEGHVCPRTNGHVVR
jgi:uncharacterized repeat protein (TIGR03847 family)